MSVEKLPLSPLKQLREKVITLPFVRVANEVVWVNPEIPVVKLTVGQPCNLGLMINLDQEKVPSACSLEVLPTHCRSALLGRVFFRDNDGTLYREIDLKGIGAIRWTMLIPSPGSIIDPFEDDTCPYGLADKDWVEHNIKMVQVFKEVGIRVCPTIAVVKLLEIIDRLGKPISLENARYLGIIAPEREPVIEIRAFATKTRALNICSPYTAIFSRSIPLFEDGKALVAAELGKKSLTIDEYLEWFAKNFGRQIRLIHNLELIHRYLTPHNVTMDCRLVDFDSVKEGGI